MIRAAVDRWRYWLTPLVLVELFVVVNLAFLAIDIYVAHSINAFHHPAEWAPFIFSLVSPAIMALAFVLGGLHATASPPHPTDPAHPTRSRHATLGRRLAIFVGIGSVLVGIAGMLFHLESQFFAQQTIKNLVYTAPFAAPLAYTGLGFLLIMSRMVPSDTAEWAGWVIFFAMGGFVGNFVLTLADHAQNGFFHASEWVPVWSSAIAVGFLAAPLLGRIDRPFLQLCVYIMIINAVVGLVGFVLHFRANLTRPGDSLIEQFLYGAPFFAPLLLPNLAILAVLGLWALSRHQGQVTAAAAG